MNFEQIIEQRIKALKEAHISNQIEGADMGDSTFSTMLERANAPITNEEFERRTIIC
ncbi:hypothetical protein [Haemophilus influenzae]|uniref:Uncharacterized protein n=1 Tax=Haemophilus influenzae TaxID=727 RepID=A0AAX3IT36_HAEIF|nr:hypothetical protein [Haemophilus influenzae]VTX66930.1 Uncharacterised protein [Haemophilus influenzae]